MEQAGEGRKGSGQPVAPVRPPGQSGEGARSALEHLIQQEKRRDAQRPLETSLPAPGPAR
jgi:hypothetical protein